MLSLDGCCGKCLTFGRDSGQYAHWFPAILTTCLNRCVVCDLTLREHCKIYLLFSSALCSTGNETGTVAFDESDRSIPGVITVLVLSTLKKIIKGSLHSFP